MINLFKVSGLFIVLFSLLTIQCERKHLYEEIPVGISKCPCDHEQSFIKTITINDILLFDINKLSFSEMIDKVLIGEKAEFICYFPEADSALYYYFLDVNISYSNSIGYLCNFPESAKEWIIPEEGICLSFSANEYEACNGHPGIGLNTYTENVLTILKKRIS